MKGRGVSWPSCHTGMVESRTASCSTMSTPRSSIDCSIRRRSRGSRSRAAHALAEGLARQIAGERGGDHHVVEPSRMPARNAGSPSHQVAMLGIARSRPCSASAERRQEREHPARLGHAGAEAVRQHDLALAHRLHQPGHAEPRARIELQRIAEVGIEAAQQHLGALEAGHRADEDAVVACRQILALDQQEAEIAGEIGVLEISLVHRPGRQHADPGIVLPVEAVKLGLQGLEERRVAAHPQVAIDVRNPVREREPVFQRIAGARRRLGAVAQHPPAAIGAARDIDGVEAQMRAAGRRHIRRAAA